MPLCYIVRNSRWPLAGAGLVCSCLHWQRTPKIKKNTYIDNNLSSCFDILQHYTVSTQSALINLTCHIDLNVVRMPHKQAYLSHYLQMVCFPGKKR